MNINIDNLKLLELKLTEYSKKNGSIAEYKSHNNNHCNGCQGSCTGLCHVGCTGNCKYSCNGSCGNACGGSCSGACG